MPMVILDRARLGIRHHPISHLVSIIDDMQAAAAEAGKVKAEWRVGANAWHAFLADLHHRSIWDARSDEMGPPTFLGHRIVRVLDAKNPTGWALTLI
jgi:hypothetical protein